MVMQLLLLYRRCRLLTSNASSLLVRSLSCFMNYVRNYAGLSKVAVGLLFSVERCCWLGLDCHICFYTGGVKVRRLTRTR